MVTFSGIISSHDFGTFSISSGNGCKKFYKPTNVKLIKNKPCVVMYDEKEKKETIRTKYIFCILQENKFVFCKENNKASLLLSGFFISTSGKTLITFIGKEVFLEIKNISSPFTNSGLYKYLFKV